MCYACRTHTYTLVPGHGSLYTRSRRESRNHLNNFKISLFPLLCRWRARPFTFAAMPALVHHVHGKSAVRVARVWRGASGVHHLVEWKVEVLLESAMERAYTHGDNTGMTATDTVKNTARGKLAVQPPSHVAPQVYAVAKAQTERCSPEHFAVALAEHFVATYPKARRQLFVFLSSFPTSFGTQRRCPAPKLRCTRSRGHARAWAASRTTTVRFALRRDASACNSRNACAPKVSRCPRRRCESRSPSRAVGGQRPSRGGYATGRCSKPRSPATRASCTTA